MSFRLSELSGSAYSTPSRSRFSSSLYTSYNNNNQTNKPQARLSSDILSDTLTASMKKQTTKSELFDIELEDTDYYKVDQVIDEINMIAAKGYGYASNSGLTDYRKSPDSSYESSKPKVGFVPIRATPTKTRTPKYQKYDLSGKSFFSEPHIYPQKPKSESYQADSINEETGEPFGNFEFFRATPIRRPRPLL
ncbi:hypothetical protein M9Y10_004581 [Tritrichomonas musculus]|uniref:Uncharacterized protein n=1 Tax=Tritrichomonas musculus TaxID=1915356 RepID=A0ABR2JJV0_9EUKA